MIRTISAVLVLGVLVLLVAESAKYLYVAQVPKSVSSKIDPSVDKLASVLGEAKTSLGSLYTIGNIFTKDTDEGITSRNSISSEDGGEIVLKIAVFSDSHNDLENLKKLWRKLRAWK